MLLPNTTQVPNVIFDIYLEQLRPTELKVLLIIIRQTLGWIQNENTKKRKEKDWISTSQLQQKSGYSKKAISSAIDTLCHKKLIDVLDRRGALCDTPKLRRGKTRLYYQLHLVSNVDTLNELDTTKGTILDARNEEMSELDMQNVLITKETHTKESREKNFTWESFLESLHDSNQRHLNIIGFFFEKKKLSFDTYEKACSALKRHARPAKLLSPFSDQEIVEVAHKLSTTFPHYTLETIHKHLTK